MQYLSSYEKKIDNIKNLNLSCTECIDLTALVMIFIFIYTNIFWYYSKIDK